MDVCEKCGGTIVAGHMYGDQFIYGSVDLRKAFRGREQMLSSWFPGGIPEMGESAEFCMKCFTVTEEEGR